MHHARKALLLGCVALGAVFCGDAGAAGAYMARAQIHLKDCFDALLPEVPWQWPRMNILCRGLIRSRCDRFHSVPGRRDLKKCFFEVAPHGLLQYSTRIAIGDDLAW